MQAKREAETIDKRKLELRHKIMVRYVGKRLCKWCLTVVPKGRICWCGDDCIHLYFLTHDWKAVRAAVFERDKGVCRHCERDTQRAQRVHDAIVKHGWNIIHPGRNWHSTTFPQADHYQNRPRVDRWRVVANRLAMSYGFGPKQWTCREWWEADHIHERVRGGRDHVDNLRTLCLRCHKVETARLARERADERRARVPLAVQGMVTNG